MKSGMDKAKIGKRKEQKGNAQKRNVHRMWTGVILSAFFAAVVVFVTMIQMEKKMMAPYEKGKVCVVKAPIAKGIVLTESNMDKYVEILDWDKNVSPSSAVTEPKMLYDKRALFEMDRGILITEGMLGDFKEATKNMSNPVVAGFKADDLSQVAGGILRSGDHIHIYCKGEEGVETVREDAVIQQVFDQNGNHISNEDHTSSVLRINIYLDKKEVEQFYQKIGDGSTRVVKAEDV